jgi:integrase
MVRERPPASGSTVSFASAAELMVRELAVNRVRKRDVEELMATPAEAGLADRTRSGIFKLLSQVFTFAERYGWCETNPCRSVRRPRVRESSEIRFLNQQELEALIASVDVSAEPFGSTDRAIFLTAAMNGMRQGELLALRWRDVDWEAKRIRVRRNYTRGHWSTPKSRSGERAVPLAVKVEVELRKHLQRSRFSGEDDLVFANPLSGEVLPHSPLVRRFKKALKAAGVRQIRFHDLRHTFGTRIAASGVPMRVLQAWMGHRDYRTTLIYADYEPGDEESDLVDAAFSRGAPAPRERLRSRTRQRLTELVQGQRFSSQARHRSTGNGSSP